MNKEEGEESQQAWEVGQCHLEYGYKHDENRTVFDKSGTTAVLTSHFIQMFGVKFTKHKEVQHKSNKDPSVTNNFFG